MEEFSRGDILVKVVVVVVVLVVVEIVEKMVVYE